MQSGIDSFHFFPQFFSILTSQFLINFFPFFFQNLTLSSFHIINGLYYTLFPQLFFTIERIHSQSDRNEICD
jgi:hypothetical protein